MTSIGPSSPYDSAGGDGLRQMMAKPAQWPPEHGVPVPVAAAHLTAEAPEPVAHVDEGSGFVAVLDLPGLLGRPAGTRAAHRHFRMVAEVHHAVRVVGR